MTTTMQPAPEKQRSWFRRHKILTSVLAVVVLGGLGTAVGDGGSEPSSPPADQPATKVVKPEAPAQSKPKAEQPKAEPKKEAPAETAGQANARDTAADYLNQQAFSRSGLIDQLKFEGYSRADATYGADHAGANWNEQAARAAKEYLDMESFSRSGLIEQLEFEGYTTAQATYGVDKAGL